ncbi:MAG: hypothetical protein ACREJX_10040, partial [Polyangiaceae bacterium]
MHASETAGQLECRQLEGELAGEREMRASIAGELVGEKLRSERLQSELAAERAESPARGPAIPKWRYSAVLTATALCFVAAIVVFVVRNVTTNAETRARETAAIRQAQAGLGQPSPRVGAILTLDAYRQARRSSVEAPLESALLSALLDDNEFAHANVPSWSLGTFVDRGRLFVMADSSNNALNIVWPAAGRSATQAIDFRPAFLCGFRSSSEVAAADAASVRVFSYSVDSGTRLKVLSRTLRTASSITALACMPRADTVAIAESNGSLSIADLANGRQMTIAAPSDSSFNAIVPSNGGGLIAAIAPAMQSFTVFSTGRGGHVLGTRRLRNPGCYHCAGRLAFDPTDSRIAWIDGDRVELGRVAAVNAGSEGYDCRACRTDAIILWSAQDPLPKLVLPGALARFDGVAREFRDFAKYRLPAGSV